LVAACLGKYAFGSLNKSEDGSKIELLEVDVNGGKLVDRVL
jgi:hypothetical protein